MVKSKKDTYKLKVSKVLIANWNKTGTLEEWVCQFCKNFNWNLLTVKVKNVQFSTFKHL